MGYTILVADDEKEIRELLRLYLENSEYEVIEAEDGQQALDILRDKKIDLCLLDIMMPKVDGYRVLQELRKESNIPVMILSAKDADSEKILGLNLGADDYMAKPFNPLENTASIIFGAKKHLTCICQALLKLNIYYSLALKNYNKKVANILQLFFIFCIELLFLM